MSSSLAKLGGAFLALGAALLAVIGILLQSALSQLAEQRRLRHEMVAERVFDEVEREIGSVLHHEANRPAAAYDTVRSDPERWSPFILGYYRRDSEIHLVAAESLAPERGRRVRAAVRRATPELDETPRDRWPRSGSRSEPGEEGEGRAPSSPDVLRQLNRGVQVRERRQRELTERLRVVAVDDQTLVVERRSEELNRHEGFVVDVASMIVTIQSWVLGSEGLGAVAELKAGTVVEGEATGFRFEHELAAPLPNQTLTLRLSQLDDHDPSATMYSLAGLLAFAVVFGLVALYRTVAVQVRFAERRDNFVSAVTHELKTPLTAIRMYAEMLRDGMVDDAETRRRYYVTITAEGERLTRLIDNVLEHAKLRRGQRRMHLAKANPGVLLREVLDLMGPYIEVEGFRTEVEVDDAVPEIECDVDAVKQVLYNVVDNALKYGRGEKQNLLVASCTAEKGEVLISLRDHGRGVQPKRLRNIFDPFFRAGSELTRSQKGTGIGLSLARDLMTRMDGSIRASNRSPGLEVQIGLPVVR